MKKQPAVYFIAAGLVVLLLGLMFGALAALQYVLPGVWRETLPFASLRPLHVSLVVFWLLLGAAGCVYYFMVKDKLLNKRAAGWQYLQLSLVGVVVAGSMVSYLSGKFGGREYWEFPPLLAIPLVAAWLVFLGVFMKNTLKKAKKWPVYYWMWLTGIVFFILSLTESYLWVLPYFRDNIVRDMAVQWKSYGAIVGSWNQLIYGAAFYMMTRISGDQKMAHSPKVFFFFFLGLFNLMFNWGHHIYVLPVSPYIKHVAYLVSMTELLIFGKIVWEWRSSLSDFRKHFYHTPYRFLAAADVWVFLNLGLAILMSVPVLNLHTHGTHVTVAHAMGTTIGINTMILLGAAYFIVEDFSGYFSKKALKITKRGYWLSNASLLLFWLSLLGAGIATAWIRWHEPELPHSLLMQRLYPFFSVFVMAGVLLVSGLILVVYPLLQALFGAPPAPEPEPLKTEHLKHLTTYAT